MTRGSGGGRGLFRIVLGCVAALGAFFASAEISHQFYSSVPGLAHTEDIIAVVVLISLAVGLSWISALAGASAALTLIALMVLGAIAWGPLYLDVDPLGLDPKEVLAFGSQQLTTAALLPALFLPGLLRWLTGRSYAGQSTVPHHDAASRGSAPSWQ